MRRNTTSNLVRLSYASHYYLANLWARRMIAVPLWPRPSWAVAFRGIDWSGFGVQTPCLPRLVGGCMLRGERKQRGVCFGARQFHFHAIYYFRTRYRAPPCLAHSTAIYFCTLGLGAIWLSAAAGAYETAIGLIVSGQGCASDIL